MGTYGLCVDLWEILLWSYVGSMLVILEYMFHDTHTSKDDDGECATNETGEQPAEVRTCQESSLDFKMLCEFLEDSVPQFAYITVPSIGLHCQLVLSSWLRWTLF